MYSHCDFYIGIWVVINHTYWRNKLANSAQARKRVRQAAKRRIHNMSIRSDARTYIKNVVKAIEAGDKKQAQELYNKMIPIVDKVANKGIFHKNKIARHKSRLNSKIKAMA